MKGDDFGDRMKMYEGVESDRRLMPLLPVIARLDGKCFGSFTHGMNKPFDVGMTWLMQETTKFLMEETQALFGYTQSDEISLVFYSDEFKSQIWFDGRIMKMCSVLASMASVKFNALMEDEKFGPNEEFKSKYPVFDCRVWNVPNKTEAANVILWRVQDAVRNSIQSAAQSVFSHKQLDKKSCSDLQEMLFQKGINWNDYPSSFKEGSFFQRQKVSRPFTSEEIEKLPKKHEARENPLLCVERSEVRLIENMPHFGKVLNREEVIFNGCSAYVEETVK